MFKPMTARLLLAGVLLAMPFAHAWGQESANSESADPFAAYHRMLTGAADQALAAMSEPDPNMPAAAVDGGSDRAVVATGSGQRKSGAFLRVESLLPVLGPILREEGVPTALAAVVLIESGGDPAALSPKGARGIWQLMPDTARRYGLLVNASQDERTDVMKSTRAAARYLRDLYRLFNNWPLALAAYNAGEDAVQGALAKAGGAGFAGISGRLPLETRNYVPAVLNAMYRLGGFSKTEVLPRNTSHVLYAAADFN